MGWTPLTKMSNNIFEKEKNELTPETGFNLVGIDYFADNGSQLYLIEHFQIMYQDALNAKKDRKNQEEYFILYKDQNNEFCCR